ncbi:MAG TPA: hypothetical protein VHA52_11740 [Candidatus Babeliaceae bacterium]|nr:hypothetical protein [Candidatus Babeliaceae bacterium]
MNNNYCFYLLIIIIPTIINPQAIKKEQSDKDKHQQTTASISQAHFIDALQAAARSEN